MVSPVKLISKGNKHNNIKIILKETMEGEPDFG
jgi:hypothetical protein